MKYPLKNKVKDKIKKESAIFIAAAVAVCSLCGCGKESVKDEGKLVTSSQVANDYYDVKLDYQGLVRSKDTRNYSFMTGGKVEAVYVEEGQFVHSGDDRPCPYKRDQEKRRRAKREQQDNFTE